MLTWIRREVGPVIITRCEYATCLVLLTLAACGLTNTADPNVLHVANVSYSDTACSLASCSGILKFRLLDSKNGGRPGLVTINSHGFQPFQVMWTNADGWGQTPWTVDRASRPYTIIICPEGVPDYRRCASGSTG